jgi:hypothetical protein
VRMAAVLGYLQEIPLAPLLEAGPESERLEDMSTALLGPEVEPDSLLAVSEYR